MTLSRSSYSIILIWSRWEAERSSCIILTGKPFELYTNSVVSQEGITIFLNKHDSGSLTGSICSLSLSLQEVTKSRRMRTHGTLDLIKGAVITAFGYTVKMK